MALRLKKLGYNNVTIFEKTNRVGGKSYNINYRGVAQPLGTLFVVADYFDTVIPLARQYGVGDLVQIPSVSVWRTNSAFNKKSKLTYKEFFLAAKAAQ